MVELSSIILNGSFFNQGPNKEWNIETGQGECCSSTCISGEQRHFSECLKVGFVIPLFKGGEKSNVSNYIFDIKHFKNHGENNQV